MSIDRHTHTTASDGTLTPTQLVRLAKKKGLTAIAVTDHDTIDGNAEAMAEGERQALIVVPGVEISVDHSPGTTMRAWRSPSVSYTHLTLPTICSV